eukprot:RCo012596
MAHQRYLVLRSPERTEEESYFDSIRQRLLASGRLVDDSGQPNSPERRLPKSAVEEKRFFRLYEDLFLELSRNEPRSVTVDLSGSTRPEVKASLLKALITGQGHFPCRKLIFAHRHRKARLEELIRGICVLSGSQQEFCPVLLKLDLFEQQLEVDAVDRMFTQLAACTAFSKVDLDLRHSGFCPSSLKTLTAFIAPLTALSLKANGLEVGGPGINQLVEFCGLSA